MNAITARNNNHTPLGKVIDILIALNLFSLYIEILKHVKISYNQRIHRVGEIRTFDYNYPISHILTASTLILLIYLIYKDRKKGILIGFISMVGLLFQNVLIGIMVKLFVTLIIMYNEKKFEIYFENLVKLVFILESAAMFHYILLTLGIESPLQQLAIFEYDLYCIGRYAAPILVLFFIFSLNSDVIKKRLQRLHDVFRENTVDNYKRNKAHVNPKYILLIAVIFSIFWAIYPYLPTINPEQARFGKDIPKYVNNIEKKIEGEFGRFSPRILLVYFMVAIHTVFNVEVKQVVTFIPILINSFLVISVYSFVYNTSNNRELASLSSLITSFGFKITVGMHSYFMSNLFGLSFILISLGYLFKDLIKGRGSLNIISMLLIILTFFIHPWTFFQYFGSLIFFFLYMLYNDKNIKKYSPLILYIIIISISYITSDFIFNDPEDLQDDPYIELELLPNDFFTVQLNAFTGIYMGIMGNSILLFVSLLGTIQLNKSDASHVYLKAFLFVSSIVYLLSSLVFPSRAMGNYIPSRLVINYPLGILSAFGITKIIRSNILSDKSKILYTSFFFVYMTTYVFRSLYHFIPIA